LFRGVVASSSAIDVPEAEPEAELTDDGTGPEPIADGR